MAKCIYPITVSNPDGMKKYKVVPCGKCTACKRRKQSQWSFRLQQEQQHSMSAAFLTITYNDENLVYGDLWPTLVKRDLQLFMKRLRKAQSLESNDKLKYYACGEYGEETFRPHYHMILFNLVPHMLMDAPLAEIWGKGNVRVDPCNIQTIQYTSKYVMKSSEKPDGVEPEFAIMSKGLGKNFLTDAVKKYYKDGQIPYVIWKDGQKMSMPRYYKDKIFTPEEIRKFGKKALDAVPKNQHLDSTKVFDINNSNNLEKQKRHDRRNKI